MSAKMARSAPSAAVRGARMTAVVRAAKRSCQNAAKAQKSTPVWGSSGESRLITEDCAPCPHRRLERVLVHYLQQADQPHVKKVSVFRKHIGR